MIILKSLKQKNDHYKFLKELVSRQCNSSGMLCEKCRFRYSHHSGRNRCLRIDLRDELKIKREIPKDGFYNDEEVLINIQNLLDVKCGTKTCNKNKCLYYINNTCYLKLINTFL